MATEGGGKIKEKRSHPSVKPYERRKSLLGKVTKTVKDLFVPSWLNEWVSKTPESRNEDGVVGDNLQRQTVQGSRLEGPQAPGPSEMPYVTPFSSSELPLPGARPPQSTPREDSRSVLSEASIRPVPDPADYQREILQLNDTGLERLRENLEKEMEETRSFLPNTDPGLSPRSMSMSQPSVQPPLTPQSFFGGGSQSQPKVYSASSSSGVRRGKPFAPAHRSRPSFNVSAFCSTSQGEQSLLGESLFESSFYSGMTTYGGASAHRRRSGGAATPYQTALPIRRQLKTRPTEQAQGAVTSSTARRILETLERMSTPLGDARRIPVETANVDSVLAFSPSLAQRTLLRSSERQSLGPPTRRLQVPGVASIAKNRQTFRLASPLTTSTPASSTAPNPSTALPTPRQPPATVTSESRESVSERLARADTVPVDKLAGGGAGGKMRRERSNHHFKAARVDNEDMMVDELPKFNTNFTLPVSGTSMPKIDFGFTSPAATAASKMSSGPSSSSTTPSSGSGNGVPALGFTFSSPISKSSPTSVNQTDAGSSPADFKFRSPVQAQGSKTATDSTKSSSSSVSMTSVSEAKTSTTTPLVGNGGFAFSGGLTAGKPVLTASSGLTSTPPTFNAGFGKSGTAFSSLGGSALTSSPPQPPMFGAAKELKSGSVMDVLGKKPSPAREEGFAGVKPAAELRTGSVMDILGKGSSPSTSKDESFSGSIRPAMELKKGSVMDILGKSASPPAPSFGVQPAKSLEQGSVNDILGGKKDAKAGEDIFAKFQAAAGSWECGSCLVQNKAEANVCVACSSAKPSAKNAVPQTTAAAAAPATDPLFAKLAQPTGMWECQECFVQNKSESSSCAACGTPKPGGASAPAPTPASASAPAATTAAPGFGSSLLAQFAKPAGGWECQACLVQNKAGEDKCVACSTARPGASSDTKKNGASGATGGSVGSLAAQFKRPAGDWDCKVCDVYNKSSVITCVCCGTPRPGMEPSAALAKTVPTTSFTLGSQTSSSSSNVTMNSGGGFSFNFSNANAPATTSGFKFGSADSNETKSGSSSQAPASGGFQFGASEQSKSLGGASALAEKTAAPALSTGGFKFGAEQQPVTSQLSSGTAGFTFGPPKSLGTTSSPAASNSIGGGLGESKAVQETSASAASVPAGAGTTPGFFGFGQKPQESQGLVSSASSLPGGFSFGQKPSNSQPPPPAAAPSGFTFGPKASEPSFPSPSPALAGIVFGQKQAGNPPATSASPAVPAVGEFSFGQKQPSVSLAPSTSVPSVGGFVFGATGVSNKAADQTVAPSPLAGVAGNAMLFGGVGAISKTADKTAGEDKARGFSFGGVTSGQPALTGAAGELQSAAATNENKPAFGGFNFGQAASTTALPGAFGMASSSGPAPGAPAKPAFPALGNKRGHDDDLNPPQAKKTFPFGNGPTEAASSFSNPVPDKFNFGAAGSAAPANSNAFKPTPNDGGFNPAPASTPNFNFTGAVNTGAVFHFGQSDSSNSTGGGQVSNSTQFNFGQPPSLPPNPSFSVPNQPSFNMGSTGQNAGGPVRQIKKAARRLKR